jgi:hypothetical protein
LSGGWTEALSEDYFSEAWLHVRWPDYNSANGETRIATGDIDDDGKDEIITGLGPVHGSPSIPGGWFQIFDDDFSPLAWGKIQWSAYKLTNGETWPTCGDVDGDGKDEIMVGLGSYPAAGGFFEIFDFESGKAKHKDWVRVKWSGYCSAAGEIRPASGDIDGDGKDEIIIGLGQGGKGFIEVLDDGSAGYKHLACPRAHWSGFNEKCGEIWPAVIQK